jgi:hypothetical protein
MERIRAITPEQREALRAVDREEESAGALAALEEEHIAAEECYLRRRDRLLGREVPERYDVIEAARSLLRQKVRERSKRLERLRMAILAGHALHRSLGYPQLDLLPGE